MSSYVRAIKHEIEFDGETVRFTLKPLTLGHAFEMRAAVDGGNEAYLALVAKLLPSYVIEQKGPHDAAGVQIPIEEICTTACFTPIIASCATVLVESSRIKNPLTSGGTSTASSPEAPAAAIPPSA